MGGELFCLAFLKQNKSTLNDTSSRLHEQIYVVGMNNKMCDRKARAIQTSDPHLNLNI